MPGLMRYDTTPDFESVNFSKNFDVAGVATVKPRLVEPIDLIRRRVEEGDAGLACRQFRERLLLKIHHVTRFFRSCGLSDAENSRNRPSSVTDLFVKLMLC